MEFELGNMLIRIKETNASFILILTFKTLEGVRSSDLKMIYLGVEPVKFACSAGIRNYISYNTTLLLLL